MNPWVIPVIRLIANNLDPIISAAKPLFTKKKAEDSKNPIALLQQQVAELQKATSDGASQLHQLAEQLKQTVAALEQGEYLAEARDSLSRRLAITAVVFSAIALVVAMIVLFR